MRLILVFILLLILNSCVKDLDLNLPQTTPKMVVEGWIENDQPAVVLLTFSSSFFDNLDSASLFYSINYNARVEISDGTTSELLTLFHDGITYPQLQYRTATMLGVIGKKYTLKVTYQGKSYSATTEILKPIDLDSVKFVSQYQQSAHGYIDAHLADPIQTGNCYRFFTKRIGKDKSFIPAQISAYSDSYFNGKQLDFSIYRGRDNYLSDTAGRYFQNSDTILVKFSTMPQFDYKFWNIFEQQVKLRTSPFVATTALPTNLSGGAVGIWGSYGSKYYLILPKKK